MQVLLECCYIHWRSLGLFSSEATHARGTRNFFKTYC
jgi:hypothetical protein